MKLTRERKMYLGVLGVVLAGLGFGLLRPGMDSASETASAAPAAASTAPRATVMSSVVVKASDDITFSDQLAQVAGDQQLAPRDFPNPLGQQCQWLFAKTSAAPVQAPAAAERFLASHSLSAVLVNGPASYAMINGHCVRLGATVDGFRLIDVQKSRAVLEANGEHLELKLPVTNQAG